MISPKPMLFFVLSLLTVSVFAQCENAQLYRQFDQKQKGYKAVSFVIDKLMINYNTWDRKSDVDTIQKKEKFWCIRENDHIMIIKTGINPGNSYSYIYYMDTVIFFSNKYGTYKLKVNDEKYASFGDGLRFLHNSKDSFFWCKPIDTVQLLNDHCFALINHFEGEYGHNMAKSFYTFNNSGFLTQFESFFDQEFVFPKYYAKTTFSEIEYYKEVPPSIRQKIENMFIAAQKDYAITKLKKVDSSHYKVIEGKHTQLKPVYKYRKAVSLDSIITKNKVTLLYFWFEGCAPCHQLKPSLVDFYNEYRAQGLELIGMDNKDKEDFIDASNEYFITYYDKLRNSKSLGSNGCPNILVFNSKGEMVGFLDGNTKLGVSEMKKHIVKLLAE